MHEFLLREEALVRVAEDRRDWIGLDWRDLFSGRMTVFFSFSQEQGFGLKRQIELRGAIEEGFLDCAA
jgi:hypothetical protein